MVILTPTSSPGSPLASMAYSATDRARIGPPASRSASGHSRICSPCRKNKPRRTGRMAGICSGSLVASNSRNTASRCASAVRNGAMRCCAASISPARWARLRRRARIANVSGSHIEQLNQRSMTLFLWRPLLDNTEPSPTIRPNRPQPTTTSRIALPALCL
jgi:hypothetical protein